jgi:hypothetical protein
MRVNEDTKECVELVARVLIRAFAAGLIFLVIWFIFFLLAKDMAFRIQEGLFGITMEQIVFINFIGMGLFKLFIFSVFLIPYVAIRWAMNGNTKTEI